MSDDELIEALRARSSKTLPEGFAAVPVLDGWRIRRAFGGAGPALLVCDGAISAGDGRFPAGRLISTSPLEEIDGDPGVLQARWIRTRNSVYKLGFPLDIAPLIYTAGARSWSAAFHTTIRMTGAHTLPANLDDAVNLLREIADQDGRWDEKRAYASRIFEAVLHQGRFKLADAWAYMAADPSDPISAMAVHTMLENEPGVSELGAIVRVREAWKFCATETVGGQPTDHVANAHKLGEMLRKQALTPHTGALFVAVARKIRWQEAFDVAMEGLPEQAAKHIREIIDCTRDASRPDQMRIVYEEYARSHELEIALNDVLRLLATDPTNYNGVSWVAHRLSSFKVEGAEGAAVQWSALADLLALNVDPPDRVDVFQASYVAWLRSKTFEVGSDAAEASDGETPGGVVVLREIGGTSKTATGKEAFADFKSIVGARLPLYRAPPLVSVRASLRDEFPHLHAEIDVLLAGLVEGEAIAWRPTLLIGEPGGGKSRLGRRLAQMLGVHVHKFDGAGSSDNAFGGTPRRWSSGEHCVPLEAVRRSRHANPWLIIDEIDKSGRSRQNGSLQDALTTLTEPENSKAFADPYLQSDCDLSHVGYVLTANVEDISAPLRDRLRIVRLPHPRIEHLPQIARSIVRDIADASPLGAEWFPPLDDGELAVAEGLWRGGSVRKLAAIVRALVDNRERRPRN